MGLFSKKIAGSKAAFGQNYGKEGRVWVIVNNGKMDMHASKNSEQIVFETEVVRVVDPGPAPGQRFKPTKGGNDTPHSAGDPYTIHFGSWQQGAEARAKRFLLVAANLEEHKVPKAINPMTGKSVNVPPGSPIHPQTGDPLPIGTPGAIMAVDPVELAIDQATNPSTNMLRDIIVEMNGRGMTTQGRGPGGKQDIIAIDPVRRVWAKEVADVWESLHPNVKALLERDNRLKNMLAREERERAIQVDPQAATQQPATATGQTVAAR
jgi:hypothetical protein